MNRYDPAVAPTRVMQVICALSAVMMIIGSSQTPVSAALFDDDEARRQIAVERKRVDEASALISTNRQQLDTVATRLGKLEDAVSKNPAVLDLFREIESIKAELAKMRGQMEVLANGIETSQKRQQDFYVDLDTRLRRLESPAVPSVGATSSGETSVATSTGAGSATPGPAAKAGATNSAAANSSAGASNAETRAYEAAQSQRRIGNYQAAILGFQSFVKQYPKSPLASSAQYWIGDSYFNLRDFRMAINSQRLLLVSYPDSPKVPDALLNIASSQLEMGDSVAARKTMDEIVAKHPASDAADKAKRRLASLR